MLNIFLSYARADGAAAAESLQTELTQMGFSVWQDVQQMRGGKAWREQLHTALHSVDALLGLLTPGYVASPICRWEWQTALTLGKRVVPLLIAPCDIPEELARLQYHNLSDPARYPLELAKLVRDLVELIPATPPLPPVAPAGAKYSIVGNRNKIIGEGATVIRVSGGNGDALLQKILSTLAQLRANAGPHQAEFDAALREISTRVGAVNR